MSLKTLLGGAMSRRVSADAPVPYVSKWRGALMDLRYGTGGGMSKTDELDQYGCTGTLFGVVSKLASTTSLVQWKLYRRAVSGLEADRAEVTNPRESAPLYVQRRPNGFMPWQEFCETFQQHIDLTGEAYWIIVRAGSVPVEIWPVRPDRMQAVPSVQDFIAGYVYTSPDGEQIPLKREDVIMLRWPAPLDVYAGQSPLPALAADLGQEDAQRAWSESFFRNSALPGGVIEIPTTLSDTQFNELSERWNRSHRGVSNAGRVAILEQGKFVPMAYNQRDMQFVETRGLTKQAILDAYAFPKFGIGDVQDVNRASADASKAYMAESLTVPRLERIKAALNFEFLPMFGLDRTHEFDYENPVPEDRETENATLTAKVNAAVALVDAGFDADEACDTVGLPRMTWEQIRRVAASSRREAPANA